jgi:hypothetical protein
MLNVGVLLMSSYVQFAAFCISIFLVYMMFNVAMISRVIAHPPYIILYAGLTMSALCA